jgi:UDP-N-acetylmuramate--alanine ligase
MSGIADILRTLGYQIQGSDATESANVERLRAKGIPVMIGQKAENLQQAAVVVTSSAIPPSNPELCEARKRGLPIVKRAEMLAEIMRLKPSIAIAGTHGKTTTTSLTATVLEAGGLDPTVISGGIINAYGTNAKLGCGEWVVAEADESDGSFTKLPATIAVVTNIEPEHMDFYASFQQVKNAFLTFMENIPFYGLVVACGDHPEVRSLVSNLTDRRVITYGFTEEQDLRAFNVRITPSGMVFDVVLSERFHRLCSRAAVESHISGIALSLLGEHNVLNALATIACGLEVGMTWSHIRHGLLNFKGVSRRFTQVGRVAGVTIIDDYAHHPTEIAVVLKTARALTERQVVAVVQPHRYSRLHHLFKDFTTCFSDADLVVVTPLYDAGEQPIDGISHKTLAQAIAQLGKPVYQIQQQAELAPLLADLTQAGDVVICMGAGSITQWAHALPSQFATAFHQRSLKAVNNG